MTPPSLSVTPSPFSLMENVYTYLELRWTLVTTLENLPYASILGAGIRVERQCTAGYFGFVFPYVLCIYTLYVRKLPMKLVHTCHKQPSSVA